MSISELTAQRLPRHTGRHLQRRLSAAQTRLRKQVRLHKKSLIRAATQWHSRQYYIWRAQDDVRRAVSANEDIFLGSLIVLGVVLFAFASTMSQLSITLFLNLFAMHDQFGISLIPLFGMFCGVLALLGVWVSAWMANMVSLAAMDGANRKMLTSLRLTFRRGLSAATRTTSAWLLYAVVTFVPALLITIVGMGSLLVMQNVTEVMVLRALVLTTSAAAIWVLYALTSYGLVPQVALFEQSLPLTKTLGRSRKLVVRRGRPFIFALYSTAALVALFAYALANMAQNVIGSAAFVLFFVALLVPILAVRLQLTTLYRKRKLARLY